MPVVPLRRTRVRALAALGGLLLLAGAGACSSGEPVERPADRVLLSPTADPATSQTVAWRGTGNQETYLEIGPEGEAETSRVPGESTGEAGGAVGYAATATGLEPQTAYRYRIGVQGPQGEEVGDWRTFTTAAAQAQPFTFLHFGDIQDEISEKAAPVMRAGLAAEADAELIVHSGDLVDDADDDSEWGEWYGALGAEAAGSMNHVASPGNHDYDGDELSDHWPAQFPAAGNGPDQDRDLSETVYYTDYQGVRFVVLNSNYRDAEGTERLLDTQRRWLDRVLADNPHPWTVVTFHHPLFSSDPERDNEPLRQAWLPTLEEHDVDLVLQGHDHSYTRGNLAEHATDDADTQTGPVYVVAVTGPKMYEVGQDTWTDHGAQIREQRSETATYQAVSVGGDTLEYEARTVEGRVVDSFTIDRSGEDKLVTDGS